MLAVTSDHPHRIFLIFFLNRANVNSYDERDISRKLTSKRIEKLLQSETQQFLLRQHNVISFEENIHFEFV
jgi:hypothetical protein